MRTAIIVGCAPSLDTQQIPHYHEVASHVVALNRAYRAWNSYPNLSPHSIYAMDTPDLFQDCQEELIQAATNSTLIVPAQPARKRVSFKQRWQKLGAPTVEELAFQYGKPIDPNPFKDELLAQPLKTLLVAWQHLIREGYDRIGIAGVDLTLDPQNRYFFQWDKLPPSKQRSVEISMFDQTETLKCWYRYSLELGVETVNLSGKKSRLAELYPTTTLGGFLSENPRQHVKDNEK